MDAGAPGHITNFQLHPHARGYLLPPSASIDLGADGSVGPFLIGITPSNRRFVIDEIIFRYTETAHNETSTISIGHRVGVAALDADSINATKTMAALAAAHLHVTWAQTDYATTLQTSKTWPGRPIIPAGSSIWATIALQGSLNNGAGYLTIRGWDWCELSP